MRSLVLPPRALRLLVVMATAALLAALLPAGVSGDGLVTSEPAAGEILGEAPHVVLLTFDQPLALEAGANSAALLDGDGVRVDDGKAEIAAYSDRALIVRLAAGVEPEGPLRAVWVVTFAGSGQVVEGSLAFSVQPGHEPSEEVEAVAEPSPPRGTESIVLWTVAIVMSTAVFVLLLYFLRVATGNAKSSVDGVDDSAH